MKKFLQAFFIAVLGGASALTLNHYFQPQAPVVAANNDIRNPYPVKLANYNGVPSGTGQVDFRDAAEQTVHAVVHVKTKFTTQATSNPFYDDPFNNWFFGTPRFEMPPQTQMASGSGVIISNDGYIVTNNHVVKQADEIQVTLNDKRNFTAKVIGTDPSTDLALLKIDATNLPFINYGNSDEVKVGEWVLAVGNPFNLTSTVTAGIVSAKARNINIIGNDPASGQSAIESFIQTDAAVNPGNSGGALVNTQGNLVGINTAIASSTGSFSGYSFAIPVNIVRKVVADLLQYGTVQRGFLGVSLRELDADLAKEKSITQIKGVYVDAAVDGSAAKDAGIQSGDIITKVGDEDVSSVPELQEQVNKFRPGDKVILTLQRGGKESTVTAVLKNKNGEAKLVEKETTADVSATTASGTDITALGASFANVSAAEMKRLGIDSGLKISKLDAGKLRNAGIREGFIITAVDKNKVSTAAELKKTLENKKGGIMIEGVYSNGMHAYYAFGM